MTEKFYCPGLLVPLFLALCLNYPVQAQNPLSFNKDTLPFLQQATDLFTQGHLFAVAENYPAALEAFQECLALRQRYLPENDTLTAAVLLEAGEIIFMQGDQETAIPYLRKSLSINTVVRGKEDPQVVREMANLARGYLRMSNFEPAIGLAEEALAIQQKILPAGSIDIIRTYYTLGECHKNLGRYSNALYYFNQLLEIKNANKNRRPGDLAGTYSQIGKIYFAQNRFTEALDFFEKENADMLAANGTGHRTYAYTCTDMARIHDALKHYNTSIDWYQKALALLRKSNPSDNEEIGLLLVELGNAERSGGDMDKAIQTFEEAAVIFEKNLGADNVSQRGAEAGLGHAYRDKYLQTGDEQSLLASRAMYNRANRTIDRLIRFENSSVVRKKWLAESKEIYGNAIATELLLSKEKNDSTAIENAWQFSETMHGFDLFASSQESRALHFSGIPGQLLEQESDLRLTMCQLQRQRKIMMEEQKLSLTDSLVIQNNALYFAEKEKWKQLLAQLEKDYSKYYNLKYQFENITIANTQAVLGKNQCLVEYFTADAVIYIFVLTAHARHLVTVPHDFPLDTLVAQFRQGINSAQDAEGAQYQALVTAYATAAQQLYQKLLAPVENLLTSEVIIIPDGALNYLPFEALLSGVPRDLSNFTTYPFWVKSHLAGYAFSATLLHQMIQQQPQVPPTGDLLAFAPFVKVQGAIPKTASRQGLEILPETEAEITIAQKYIGGRSRLFTGKEATVEQFYALASQYRIIHLATHAKINNNDGAFSFLAFYNESDSPENGVLYASDIYNMSISADLLMLSACETGTGQLFRGEGMMSLSRAFAFAGAKSIINSLWNVNDQSTQYLMDHFYKEIQSGSTKTEALSQAKRTYLKAHPGWGSHPFFWAGFVETGDWGAMY